MTTRAEQWDRLQGRFDILVIGGGITGAGIARDAARRGLSVAVAEMDDLAFGTSSRSSKLVHGGLRYLENYEFGLVFEAVSERQVLQKIAPHLVNPLGFMFPIYRGRGPGLWLLNAGMWLYAGMTLFRATRLHRNLTPAQAVAEEPGLRTDGLRGAPLYWDASTDDARLTLETAVDAAWSGAVVATHAKVVELEKDGSGKLVAAIVACQLTGERRRIEAGAIINATGPWSDDTQALDDVETPPVLRPTKGIHVVVPHRLLPIQHAVVCYHPTDHRVLFALPWGDRTYLGTTDTDYQDDPADVAATADDVAYLLEAARWHFPETRLTEDDVVSTWAGVRPLMAPDGVEGVHESQVSREHQIRTSESGLITIAGGKLTTYRRMARECVDVALKRLGREMPRAETDGHPLPGAIGWPADDDHDAVARVVEKEADGRLAADSARHLADTYGMRSLEIARRIAAQPALAHRIVDGCRDVWAQVDWAVDEELAATVADVFIRRTQLFFRAHDQGLAAAPRVAARMQTKLGWTDAERERSLAAYRADVARSRAWRDEPLDAALAGE